ncbi:hypothetical protein C8J57DRAFT_1276465 [Mycena rebaudengoi]|nr:hypothetical protein C8J57DRAFT_1276465 [Mycena rebaudengoi]
MRPKCLARERMRMWRPSAPRAATDSSGHSLPISDADLARISDVLMASWAEGTIETYGSGLLSFHVYCDSKSVPESQRAPASPTLVAAYISTLAGFLSGGTLSNYVAGVQAWHILHGVAWMMNKLDGLLKAADALTPSSSKRKAREPYTPQTLTILHPQFDLNNPLDAAAWSCMLTLFYSTSRGGEFTLKNLSAFDAAIHVKRSDITTVVDRNGLKQTDFFLPKTKSAPQGEHLHFAKQNGVTDPEAALTDHFRVNNPPPNSALFSHRFGGTHRPLTKSALDRRIKLAFKGAGVPLDVMKVKGRWASNSFERYLRKHAEIMAPYFQAIPQLHEDVLRIMMPRRVR